MRLALAIVVPLAAGACVQTASAPRSQAELMAVTRTAKVDLSSADGMLFLQSAHTGFMEAPPTGVPAPAKVRAPRPAYTRGDSLATGPIRAHSPAPAQRVHHARAGAHVTSASPEIGDRGPIRVIGPHVHNPRIVAKKKSDLPQITVRPPQQDTPPANSLRDAFEAAYDENPSINQARSNLRAADEGIAVAKAGNRPTITAVVDSALQHERSANTPTGGGASDNLSDSRTPTELSLNISQPLFRGFRTRNATRQAEATVRAERERLRAAQQDVFLNTAIAFVDVRRFRSGVFFREQEVAFLREQVSAAQSRQEFGEGTRTDIDQAEARLSEAMATLATERASLAEAEARFQELTGRKPAKLERELSVAKFVPPSLAESFRRAQD
ncbi:MAG: TolC family protein, partial [Pseudomonadota bacterium]